MPLNTVQGEFLQVRYHSRQPTNSQEYWMSIFCVISGKDEFRRIVNNPYFCLVAGSWLPSTEAVLVQLCVHWQLTSVNSLFGWKWLILLVLYMFWLCIVVVYMHCCDTHEAELLVSRHTPVSTYHSCCLVSSCVRTSCQCSLVVSRSFKGSASCQVCNGIYDRFLAAWCGCRQTSRHILWKCQDEKCSMN